MNTRSNLPDSPPRLCPERITSVADWKQVQLVMAEALFRPLTRGDTMQPRWKDGRQTASAVAEFMVPNDRMTAVERLEIYNRQYWFRLLDCLYDDYPGLRSLLGDGRFHTLCRDYLALHPSESWTLRNLGSKLVSFLEAHPRWSPALHAQAVDVARVEWAQTLAFDEAANPPLEGDALLGANPEELCLGLQPYLGLLELDHEVDKFMRIVRQRDLGLRSASSNAVGDHAKPEPGATGRRPALRRKRIWLAVHRHDQSIYFKRLEQESYLVLNALRSGCTLADAVGVALEATDPAGDWVTRIQGNFATWAELGWLCPFSECHVVS